MADYYTLDETLTGDAVNEILLDAAKHPYLTTYNNTASITLPLTPTIMHCTNISGSEGIDYDLSTGVITFENDGIYKIVILMNAEPSASGKNIYFYAEGNAGSGWVVEPFSGRQKTLVNAATEQVVITAATHFPAGFQLRFYVWGDATVYLKTVALGSTGASLVAGRLMISR